MHISYIAPLSKAWNRMIKILFKPFYINKWFVLGFSAFLAGLLDWTDRGSSSYDGDDNGRFNAEEFFNIPETIKGWYANNPDWFALVIAIAVVIFLILVLLTWLSSRGKFMFLDNVVHNRALVKKPWEEFKRIGNSLFLWRLGYGIVLFVLFSTFLTYAFYDIREMYEMYESDRELIIAAIKVAVLFVFLLIVSGYISLFLDDFVVPLMYKTNSMAWIGWSHFMPLFTQNFFYFILYGLFIFFLVAIIVLLIIITGLLTCCIGFAILIIPYIGSVLLLPVSVTIRSVSLEFLEQFGEQYKIFPEDEQKAESD